MPLITTVNWNRCVAPGHRKMVQTHIQAVRSALLGIHNAQQGMRTVSPFLRSAPFLGCRLLGPTFACSGTLGRRRTHTSSFVPAVRTAQASLAQGCKLKMSAPRISNPVTIRPTRAARKGLNGVLSLDGGGMRGLIAARLAEEVEDAIREIIINEKPSSTSDWLQDLQAVDAEGQTVSIRDIKDYPKTDVKIHLSDYFNLICGTSTGGLLATYFATQAGTAKDIQKLYNEKGAQIFDKEGSNGTAHSSTGIEDVLKERLGDISFQQLNDTSRPPEQPQGLFCNLGVTAFDVNAGRGVLFWARRDVETPGKVQEAGYAHIERTGGLLVPSSSAMAMQSSLILAQDFMPMSKVAEDIIPQPSGDAWPSFLPQSKESAPAAGGPSDAYRPGPPSVDRQPQMDLKLWEVVRCSSAAPTYFPPHDMKLGTQTTTLVDGGVVANDPTQEALAQALYLRSQGALTAEGLPPVLSLGCGTVLGPVFKNDPGLLNTIGDWIGGWIRKWATAVPLDKAKWALGIPTILFGGALEESTARFQLICEQLAPGKLERLHPVFYKDGADPSMAPGRNVLLSASEQNLLEVMEKMDDASEATRKALEKIADIVLDAQELQYRSRIRKWVREHVLEALKSNAP